MFRFRNSNPCGVDDSSHIPLECVPNPVDRAMAQMLVIVYRNGPSALTALNAGRHELRKVVIYVRDDDSVILPLDTAEVAADHVDPCVDPVQVSRLMKCVLMPDGHLEIVCLMFLVSFEIRFLDE
jgi:hypothetical protein